MSKRKRKDGAKNNNSEFITRESFSAVCALFSACALFVLFTGSLVFGEIGSSIQTLLLGIFGYAAYPLFAAGVYLGVTSLFGARLVKRRKTAFVICLSLVFLGLILHTAFTYPWKMDGYLTRCFKSGENFPSTTATGWFGGLFVAGLVALTTKVGAIVIFSALFLLCVYLSVVAIRKKPAKTANVPQTPQSVRPEENDSPITIEGQAATESAATYAPPVNGNYPSGGNYPPPQPQNPYPNGYGYGTASVRQSPGVVLPDESGFSPFAPPKPAPPQNAPQYEGQNGRDFLFGLSPSESYQKNLLFDANANVNKRPPMEDIPAPQTNSSFTPSYLNSYETSVNTARTTPAPRPINEGYAGFTPPAPSQASEPTPSVYNAPFAPEPTPAPAPAEPTFERQSFLRDESEQDRPILSSEGFERTDRTERNDRDEYSDYFSLSNPNIYGRDEEDETITGGSAEIVSPRENDRVSEREESRFEIEEPRFEREEPSFEREDRNASAFDIFDEREDSREEERRVEPVREEPKPVPAPPPPPKPRVIKPYVRVPLDYFDCRDVMPDTNEIEVARTKEEIVNTLASFKINDATVSSVTFGPTVTRYNVVVPRHISSKKVVALDQDIALNLQAAAGVNMYPNFEDGAVSIEVPNRKRQFVQLGCMLTGDAYVNAKPSSLTFVMGKDVGNRKVYGDICKMIHLLVAGSSGSGKSVFLGSLIISLINKYSPAELRLILIDPKKTEFVLYNNLPHLMINEIITDVHKAIQSLNWAIGEMNRRYGLFEQMSRAGTYVVNIDEYNSHLAEGEEKLPKIVIIIDELADLMLAAKKDVEDRIQNLTQKARAAGIHLIVATQRPSADVITGVIKGNLPTRIAFAVAAEVDSRVILDQTGAQKLLGKGDFLYTMSGVNTPVRVQSAFISSEESQNVINFIKMNNEAYFDESATAFINNSRPAGDSSLDAGEEGVEGVYVEALRFVILSGSASISMIQRKCSVGYNKAGKIIEWMEEMGYISTFDGAKARKVLITKEEFESKYGAL
ncbi:MAG: hypothetical protein IJ506_00965 [Clostridia bacterium]|nr:hypothetical protein [Clostridia bacterium]